jgi:hypothetical protein
MCLVHSVLLCTQWSGSWCVFTSVCVCVCVSPWQTFDVPLTVLYHGRQFGHRKIKSSPEMSKMSIKKSLWLTWFSREKLSRLYWWPLRIVIIKESQPVKNGNLSRLVANLNRQNWSSELTVFIVFQQCLLFYNCTTSRSTQFLSTPK